MPLHYQIESTAHLLCHDYYSFKEELVTSLNQAYPDAGTVRLEARSRFIARVVDAIEAALSKHDQVFIPASTRLGRVRATVPTCVACDRPLTTRGKRSSEIEKADATTTGMYKRELLCLSIGVFNFVLTY